MIKYTTNRSFADPDMAARKLVEIASTIEAVQHGRILIEHVNRSFLDAGGTPDQYRADTVRNLDAWYRAFNIQPGRKLYLAPEARVRVW